MDSKPVLVHTPTGRDARVSAELLTRAGLTVQICETLHEVIQGLLSETAAVFISEESLFGRDISALSDWVTNQDTWSDMPFVVLTSHHDEAAVVAWRHQMVSLLRNVSLLERPLQPITLTSSVQSAVRARLRQYEVRDLLDQRAAAAVTLESLVIARTRQLEEANLELRRQMAERARVEEALLQTQKIEAIGQLTGGVAHDFNNLLMVVSSGLDLLQRRPEDPVRRTRLIARMREAVQRGSALTRQLLAFSRRQALRPQSVDLVSQIGGMRELLDRSLSGDIEVQLEFADELWRVEVDPGELELALLNLAVNARDAMPAGGTVLIRASNAPNEQIDGRQGDFVRICVSDCGTGMTPEVLARVFEPFFTTKEIGKGSGLGLAQVYGFAKQSGGTVQIDTNVGHGTNVAVLLPRSHREPLAVHSTNDVNFASTEQMPSTGCVLLVEDDDEVASLVTDMLRELGYRVVRAGSSASALGALANGRDIDIVFSDVMMPGGMNGIELAREIRRRREEPVLLTSGYADAVKEAAAAQGIVILPKPYEIDDLALALHTVRSAGASSQ
jgi:signal transduction histidine kinase/ActR/RegA family two-component response regulator